MKKYLLTALVVLTTLANANAEKKEVVINPRVYTGGGHHYPRTPIRTPEVYINDYTLLFDSSFEGFTIELLQDEEVVYSDIIDENGEVQLPDNLVGEYELRFCVGSFTFVGEIDL